MTPKHLPIEYSSGRKLYECTDCLGHFDSTDRLSVCPDCGGQIENLTKARAE